MYVEHIADRVREKLHAIDEARKSTAAKIPRTPNYHFFRYRGYECGAIQCTSLNSSWVAFVRFTQDASELTWPARRLDRPFEVGIDFDFTTAKNGGERIVGFHLHHLLYEMSKSRHGVDYAARQLREFIDVCLERPTPNSTGAESLPFL